MIEGLLVFVRNCVMAVLAAWAGIQLGEPLSRKPSTDAAPAAKASVAATPGALTPAPAAPGVSAQTASPAPSSSAASDAESLSPDRQPNVLTIR